MRTAVVSLVVVLAFGNSFAENWLQVENWNDNGPWVTESDLHRLEDIKGYSAGSGLRSIAHGSASKAYTAVTNQYSAGQQASYAAQNHLAQAAKQAAATAKAALAGKEVLFQNLEKQVEDAHEALVSEVKQLKLAENTVAAAKEAAESADEQVRSLERALKNAESAAEQAREAAEESAAELASQSSMVGTAQERLNTLSAKWRSVEVDYEATRQAAEKASISAHLARENASTARAYANHKIHESVLDNEEELSRKYEVPSLWHYRHRQ